MPFRHLLAAPLALLVLAVCATSAHAGAMTLNASIKGAGQITAVAGGEYDCDKRAHELESDDAACDTATYNAVFSVSLTLKAVAQDGWQRVSWEGCDEIVTGQCKITGPATSRGYKTVRAVFDDVQGPALHWTLQRHNPDSTLDFAWTTDEPATAECGFRGYSMWACTSPFRTHIMPVNNYGWDIALTDRNGSVAWYKTPVYTDVQSRITQAPRSHVNSTSAQLSFDTPGSVDGYECRLDGGAWTPCSSPWRVEGLSQGRHTADVRGHRNGSYEIAPSTAAWVVDTAAPNTTITAGPDAGAQVPVDSANLWHVSTESGSFECRIDGGEWTACGSSKTYAGLGDGAHTFEVRAIDEAGNVDPTPASRSWSVDTTPSTTSLAGAAAGRTVSSTEATWVFSADDGARFECRLDDGAWKACTSPWKVTGLADGPHTVRVRSIDDVENVEQAPAVATWTVDTRPTAPPVDETPAGGGSPGADAPSPAPGGGTGSSDSAGGGQPTPRVSVPEPRAALPQLLGRAKGVARVDRRGRFAVRGLTVACPADGVCTVAVKAGGRVPARGTAKVAAGRSAVVAGRIGAAALKRLKPGRTATVRLQVTVTGPGGTVAKTVAVKLRRR